MREDLMHREARGVSATPEAGHLAAFRAAMTAGRPADILQTAEAVIVTATDPAVVVEAVSARAEVLAQLGLSADAFRLLRSTRDQELAAGRPGEAAKLKLAEAALDMVAGDVEMAKTALIEAANDFDSAGQAANQIRTQLELAAAFSMTSEPDHVRQILIGCLAAAQQLGDPEALAQVRHQEGCFLAVTRGDPVPSFEDGLLSADRSASPGVQVQLRADLAGAIAGQDPGRAVSLVTQAEDIASALADLTAGVTALATAAQGWWAIGRADDGLRCSEQALGRLREADAWPMFARLAAATADVCTATGRLDEAQRYVGQAVAAGEQVGGPAGAANVMVVIGQAAWQRGDRPRAQQAYRDAVSRLQAAWLPVPPQLLAALNDPGRPTRSGS
jgi:tetratricopeptide (TPR) repeat protein